MATKQEKWQEIANRGLQDSFDPDTRARFDEAVNRGLITIGGTQDPTVGTSVVEEPLIALPAGMTQEQFDQAQADIKQEPEEDILKFSREHAAEKGLDFDSLSDVDKFALRPNPIADFFTGRLRKTKETEALPRLGQLNLGLGKDLKRAAAMMTASSPEERVKMIKDIDPGATFRYDEKGNIFGTLSSGEEGVLNPPGLDFTDILKLAAEAAKFAPATRAATIPGRLAGAAATATAAEAGSAALGGEFEPGQIALETGLSAIPEIPGAIRAARASRAPAALTDVAPSAATAPGVEPAPLPTTQPGPIPSAPVADQTISEIGTTARRAAEGSTRAKRVLAEQAAPDPKVIAAAKRLGVEEFLQPDHVSTNQSFREFSQAVKSIPGSQARAAELAGYEAIGKRADKLIEELGGKTDLSAVDFDLKNRLSDTIAGLEKTAKDLYGNLREAIPARAPVEAKNLLAFIDNKASELGGEQFLEPMERRFLKSLSVTDSGVQPTYARLDSIRRQLTAARIRKEGPFKDADTGLIKKLEKELSKDQRLVAEQFDSLDLFESAQGSVAVRKGIEKDMTSLFGKSLDRTMLADLSSATKKLSSGDTSKFVKLFKSLNMDALTVEQRQEIVSSGLNAAFGKNAKNGQLNFTSYAKWFDGLTKNKRAMRELMENLPRESRKGLFDLFRVSDGIRKASRERITTGRISAVKDEIQSGDNLMGSIYSLANRSAKVAALEAVTTPLGAPGAGLAVGIASAMKKGKPDVLKAADELINSPQFIKAAVNPTEKTASILSRTAKFKKFAKELGNPTELQYPVNWILAAIRADNATDTEQ